MLGLGPRCRRFESFRPDQKIQTVAFAAVLIFCLERADSNDKILLSGSNLISFCYCGFHIGIYKSCLMFYNGVESTGFIGFGAVVARRRGTNLSLKSPDFGRGAVRYKTGLARKLRSIRLLTPTPRPSISLTVIDVIKMR